MDIKQASPRVLSLETSTKCTGGCYVCPSRMMDRQNKEMAQEDILDITKQACDMGIEIISPHLWGEPTMHSSYVDNIYKLDELRKQYKGISLSEYTNGSGWGDDSICEAMLDVFNNIAISIDGATHETMAKTRPGLDPVEIENNVKKFYNMRKERGVGRPHIAVRKTVMPMTEHETDLYYEKWQPYVDNIYFHPLQNFDESLDDEVSLRANRACDRLFWQIVVTVSKNVVLCCSDYKELFILGNLNDGTLEEFWYGDKMEEVREKHLQLRSGEFSLCSACTYRLYLIDESQVKFKRKDTQKKYKERGK